MVRLGKAAYFGPMIDPRTRRLRRCSGWGGRVAAFGVTALADPPGLNPRPPTGAGRGPETQDQQKALREQDLERGSRAEQRQAAETEAKLRAEIDAISEDRASSTPR